MKISASLKEGLLLLLLAGLLLAASGKGAVLPAAGMAARVEEARRLYYEARATADPKARRALFERGLEAASDARKTDEEDPGAVLWWSANIGALAEIKKNPWSLGVIKDVERELKALAKREPRYGFAAADRALGKIYEKAPRFFSIGSSSKALERLKRAIELAPEFPGNQIALASFYFEEGNTDEARAIAEKVKKSPAYAKNDYGPFAPDRAEWEAEIARILAKGRSVP